MSEYGLCRGTTSGGRRDSERYEMSRQTSLYNRLSIEDYSIHQVPYLRRLIQWVSVLHWGYYLFDEVPLHTDGIPQSTHSRRCNQERKYPLGMTAKDRLVTVANKYSMIKPLTVLCPVSASGAIHPSVPATPLLFDNECLNIDWTTTVSHQLSITFQDVISCRVQNRK